MIIIFIHSFDQRSLIRKIIDGGLPKLLTSLGWQVSVASPLIFNTTTDESTPSLDVLDITLPYEAKNCLNVGRSCETMKSHIISNCDNRTFPLILG